MKINNIILPSLLTLAIAACGHDDDHDHEHNENEVITTVILTFTPDEGGAASLFEFDDPDGDGGNAPTVDAIALAPGSYGLVVAFENRLETPAEDITEEVEDEATEHQVFLTGSAVDGPATMNDGAALGHAYDDADTDGNPIGLSNSIDAVAGSGDLILTLRHLPPVGGSATKTAMLAEEVANGGFAAIAGASDVSVTFSVTVN